jgi:hypothetical protein
MGYEYLEKKEASERALCLSLNATYLSGNLGLFLLSQLWNTNAIHFIWILEKYTTSVDCAAAVNESYGRTWLLLGFIYMYGVTHLE